MLSDLSLDERRSFWGVVVVCVAIFFADASHSVVIPIFPAFAEGLGANLEMIGIYGSAVGVAMVLLSIPIGSISDRIGRRGVMMLGYVLFITVPLLYTISREPIHLLGARLLLGIAQGSTFSIGFIWVSEAAPKKQRALLQGLYMTMMGSGFTLGPILGGFASSTWNYYAAFMISSLLGFAGLVCLFFSGKEVVRNTQAVSKVNFREAISDARIFAAGVSNFVNTLMYSSLITFYPLYGVFIGLTSSEIGLCFTVRGLVSTVIRFPAGAVSRGKTALTLITLSLALSSCLYFALAMSSTLLALLLILALLGFTYGVFLTSGNVYVTQEASPEHRGAAMGVYSSFGNVSNVVSPLILGGVAQIWGLETTFEVTAIVSSIGILAILLA
ncbi:MAG: MFS transporter [Candidatus Bathyarchaeia archaeon]|jgi:MFS family permease